MGVVGGGRMLPLMYTCMHMHTHVCAYDIIGKSQGFPQWGQPFAIEIIMFNMCVCMHVHACMCMCVGVLPQPPTHYPPEPSPPPRAEKTQIGRITITLE